MDDVTEDIHANDVTNDIQVSGLSFSIDNRPTLEQTVEPSTGLTKPDVAAQPDIPTPDFESIDSKSKQ